MKNELLVKGNQSFMGKEIPVVLGGFGFDKKCISDKTIAEVHTMQVFNIRARITDNIKRFKEDIDIIDLKQRLYETNTLELLYNLGYAKQSITQAEHIYLLSERGYAKLIKIMDTDLAWEIHDKLIDEYFKLKEEKKQSEFKVPLKEQLEAAAFVADDLRVPQSNKIMMFRKVCENNYVNSNFLPAYVENEDRETKAATTLLKELNCNISAVKFNKLLLEAGILEERERASTSSKTGTKKYKALTKDGEKYGKNLTSDKNSKEVQPHYYVDTFEELLKLVMQEVA